MLGKKRSRAWKRMDTSLFLQILIPKSDKAHTTHTQTQICKQRAKITSQCHLLQ